MKYAIYICSFLILGGCEWHIIDDGRGASGGTAASVRAEIPPHYDEPADASTDAPLSCDVAIDRWKELLVINRSVLSYRRTKNETEAAAWSFRSRICCYSVLPRS